jgi:hypothetical protein
MLKSGEMNMEEESKHGDEENEEYIEEDASSRSYDNNQ